MTKDDADAAGAIAFFEDKYGDEVRVVQAGSESLELCGGTHVARLGQIGPVEIVSEGSIGSNLRRIFATTGTATLARLRQAERQIADAAALLRSRPDELTPALERKLGDLRDVEGRLRQAEQTALAGQAQDAWSARPSTAGWWPGSTAWPPISCRSWPTRCASSAACRPSSSAAARTASGWRWWRWPAKGGPVTAPELIAAGGPRPSAAAAAARTPSGPPPGGKDASRLDEALEQIRARLGR